MKNGNEEAVLQKVVVWLLAVIVIGIALSGGDNGNSIAGETSQGNSVVSEPNEAEPVEDETEVEQTAVTEPVPSPEEDTGATLGEKNAAGSAKKYINFTAFSYDGLVKQLEFEEYSHDEAIYGVDQCGADWYEQAVIKAKDYLGFTTFSYKGLIQQLEFEDLQMKRL